MSGIDSSACKASFFSRLARLLLVLVLLGLGAATATVCVAAESLVWPVPDWQTALPQSQGMSPARVQKIGQWLKDHGSKTGLLIRHGRIVGEWYFDDATPKSTYLVFSTTKSFSATAAGIAIAEGKLSLDLKLGKVVNNVAPAGKREVNVRQILSMDTGVHNDHNPEMSKRVDLFTYAITQAPMDFPPGTKWDYNNTGAALLGPMMRATTGQDIDAYLAEKMFAPIGIKPIDWSWDKQEGHAIPFSGLHITARALARFGLMTLREGRWQEKQIVPAAWVKQATSPSQPMNPRYGFLWWNNTTGAYHGVPKDAFAATGRFDNSMLIVPSLDLIVLRQIGRDPDPKRRIDLRELFALAAAAVEPIKRDSTATQK